MCVCVCVCVGVCAHFLVKIMNMKHFLFILVMTLVVTLCWERARQKFVSLVFKNECSLGWCFRGCQKSQMIVFFYYAAYQIKDLAVVQH
jgi:hypothetical protein